jgi:hypothetical protein
VNDPVGLLEDRVARAAARLRELTAERDALRRQVEASSSKVAGEAERWRSERGDVAAALRQAVSELWGDRRPSGESPT